MLIALGVVGTILLSRSGEGTIGTVKLAALAAWVGLTLAVVGGGARLVIRQMVADLSTGG